MSHIRDTRYAPCGCSTTFTKTPFNKNLVSSFSNILSGPLPKSQYVIQAGLPFCTYLRRELYFSCNCRVSSRVRSRYRTRIQNAFVLAPTQCSASSWQGMRPESFERSDWWRSWFCFENSEKLITLRVKLEITQITSWGW